MSPDDAAVLAAFPDAAVDHDNLPFYRGLLARRFLVNRCADCGHWHVPPRPICPKCWSSAVVPTEIRGDGVVHLVVWLGGAPLVDDGPSPYALATVELAEQPGLRISTMLADCPKQEVHIGLEVRLEWAQRSGVPYPVVVPVHTASASS